ncbi:hypothetical protein [Vibrio sp. Evd11]|uniref:hypothetical protein n=1 Tax=Vibrio sp. Evd11 TaxID=1207404 RepID=UPI000EFCBF65|nr:hypothetical protein [Vibrio sp. Evd11]
MKYLITCILGFVLMACGGGGGGSDNSASTPSTSDNDFSASTPNTVTNEPITMQDLTLPEDFNYNPIKKGTLNVDISNFSSQRAHLSLYKEFEKQSSESFSAHYPSKVMSVPLNDGKADFDFNLADSQENLLVEIWFYDGTDPIQKLISAGDTDITL